MTYKICKVMDGRPMWLRKFSPEITWVARAQGRGFKTKDEAARVASRLTATGQVVTVVKDALPLILSAALIVLAGAASAQEVEKIITPDALAWRQHPVFKEAQTAILLGDPTKAELIVQRVKFPPNSKVPPHTHPYA